MKSLRYFLFAIVLFMAFTTRVEAKTQCVYNYNDIKIVLSTTDDDNILDKITDSGNYKKPYKIATGNKIKLKDGKCPNVYIVDRDVITGPYRRVYSSKSRCTNDNYSEREMCKKVSGVKDTSGQTGSSLTGGHSQFDLIGSASDSCDYSYESTDGNVTMRVTRDGDALRFTCNSDQSSGGVCNFKGDRSNVENSILSGDNFSCPTYIYADITFRNLATEVELIETGTEADTNFSQGSSWQRPNTISGDVWNDPTIDCPDIFSEEPGSVGSILRTILGYIRIIGPILVVLLSAIDFIKAIFGFDEKAMGTAYRKLIIRLIAAIALFLIPTLIDVLLDFINATTCTDFFK